MNKAQKKVSLFKTTIGKTLKGLGLAFSGVAVGKLVTDFTKTAMRTEVLDVAMKSVARASGYATQALQEHRKAVMDMGIAEQEASQILTRFMQAQLDTADAAKLARVAQDAAVIAGYNSSQAAEQMTEAIAKQRPELLSAFGMTRNLNAIYDDYSKTLGKTRAQLSEAEKKQAMLNYILAEGEKIAGTYEASMGAVGKQIGSLPRYWQTLQNAIAKPLILPGLGEAVEGITSALKNAISWAEANKDVLRRWGQSIAGVVRTVVKGFSLITGAIVKNWQAIKFVGTTLLTYVVITKGVAAATTAWRLATLALKGELMTKVPVLTAVSTAIGTYRLQMALAPVATNIFSAALYRLQAALYAVHAALGPIGWAILGISAAVAGGTALWNKYTQSLQKAVKTTSPADLAKGFGDLEKSTKKSADATEEQADALTEAGKAANKNLQSFDEVHTLQEDMSDSAGDLADSLELDDISVPGVGGFEIPDIGAQLEEMKPTLAGFWEWIKEQAGNVWEAVKRKWNSFVEWVKGWSLWSWIGKGWESFITWAGSLWEGIKEKWNGFWDWVKSWGIWQWLADRWDGLKEWAGNVWEGVKERWEGFKSWVASWAGPLWDGIKEKWAGFKEWAGDLWEGIKEKWNGFKAWAGEVFGPLWEGIKEKWGGFKEWAGNLWDGMKEKWGGFTDWVQEKWSSFKDKAGEIWTGIKTNVQTKWEELKENAPVIWENIKTSIQTRWENLKTSAGEAWNNITTGIKEKWEELKTNAPTTWENIKTSIQDRWNSLVSGASEKWGNIKSTISEKWEELKTNAPTVWENIKTSIQDRWENLKTNAPTTWENIKKEISNRWEALKTDAPTAWENIRKSIADKWEELKTNAPTTWENIKKEITDRWEALKEDTPQTWDEISEKLADIWDGIKTTAEEKWDGVTTVIKGAVNGIIGFINKFIKAWNKIELKVPEVKIPLVGTVGGWSVRLPQIPEIPMLAKGGLVMDPTLAMLGEAGPEAVVPLGRSGFAGDLADTVAQAVYQAIMDAIRISRASSPQSSDEKEIVLKIDNTVLARMQLPALTREAQRQGFDLVLRPQGV